MAVYNDERGFLGEVRRGGLGDIASRVEAALLQGVILRGLLHQGHCGSDHLVVTYTGIFKAGGHVVVCASDQGYAVEGHTGNARVCCAIIGLGHSRYLSERQRLLPNADHHAGGCGIVVVCIANHPIPHGIRSGIGAGRDVLAVCAVLGQAVLHGATAGHDARSNERLLLAGIGQVFPRCGRRDEACADVGPLYRHNNILAHLLVAVAGGRKAEGVLACGQILCGKIKSIACCRTANGCLFAVLHLVPLEGYSASALYIDKKRPRTAISHAHLGGIVHALDGDLGHRNIGQLRTGKVGDPGPAALERVALRQQVGQRQAEHAVDFQPGDDTAALGIDDLRRTGIHRQTDTAAVLPNRMAVQVDGVRTVDICRDIGDRRVVPQQRNGSAVWNIANRIAHIPIASRPDSASKRSTTVFAGLAARFRQLFIRASNHGHIFQRRFRWNPLVVPRKCAVLLLECKVFFTGYRIIIQQCPRLLSRAGDGSIRTAAKFDICRLRDGQRLDSSCKTIVDHQRAAVLHSNRAGVSGFIENQPLAAGHHDASAAADGVAVREEHDVFDKRHIRRQGIVRQQGHIINVLACQGIGQMLVIGAIRLHRELGAAGHAHAVPADFPVGAGKMTDGAFAVLPFVVSVFPSAGTFAVLPGVFFVVGQYVKAGSRMNCLCAGIRNLAVPFQGFPLRDCRQPGASRAVQGAERPALKRDRTGLPVKRGREGAAKNRDVPAAAPDCIAVAAGAADNAVARAVLNGQAAVSDDQRSVISARQRMAVQVQRKRAAVDVGWCRGHVVQQGQRAALRLLCGGQGFFKGAVMGRGSIHRQRSQSVHGLLGDDLDVGQGSYLRCRDLRAGVPPVDKGITVR